jgi:outer membrane lipoprotein-sorting protein
MKTMHLKFIFVFVFFSGSLMSQPSGFRVMQDIARFKSNLNDKNKSLNSIESSFFQEKKLDILTEKIISKGVFYFKKPGMLRWEYSSPFPYLVILNNNKVLVKDEKKQTKYDLGSNKMFKEINTIMLGAVQGNLFNDETSYRSAFYENEKYYLVEMAPLTKTLKEYLQTICIYFDKKDLTVSSLKMTEPSGDYSIITFTGKKLNSEITGEKFIIK